MRPHSRRPRAAIAILALLLGAAACQKYVPANLPIQTEDSAEALAPRTAYRDDLGREIGGADADGPEYRITLQDGTQFFMKGPVIRGDSVIGYYRPTSGTAWARASIELTDMRLAERQETDWLATMSLATVPITLGLLLTW